MEHLFSMQPYESTTENITITVRPLYLDGQSDAIARKFVFAYFIRIENNGMNPCNSCDVTGSSATPRMNCGKWRVEGVVGQQPFIHLNKGHEYNSYCVLDTFEGTMEGTYMMRRPEWGVVFCGCPPIHTPGTGKLGCLT